MIWSRYDSFQNFRRSPFLNAPTVTFFQGLFFIHNSQLRAHGFLKLKSCLVDQHFILKIGDTGYNEIAMMFDNTAVHPRKIIRSRWRPCNRTKKYADPQEHKKQISDIQSFGTIAFEICFGIDLKSSGRDPAKRLRSQTERELRALLYSCEEFSDPSLTMLKIRTALSTIFPHTKRRMVEIILARAAAYAEILEDSVYARTLELRTEQAKADFLLEQMLPR